jgi:hypothetical protein
MLTEEKLLEVEDDFRDLVQTLQDHEATANGIAIFDAERRTLALPKTWVSFIGKSLPKLAAQFIARDDALYAPMTAKLKALAKVVGLPEYEGKTLRPMRAPEHHAIPRVRCPMCGGWMEPKDVVMWKKSRKSMLDNLTSPRVYDDSTFRCEDCGTEVDVTPVDFDA